MSADTPAGAGQPLVYSEESDCHRLGGEEVADGELLELLTEGGWLSGHFRSRLHSDTGYPVLEVHLGVLEGQRRQDQLEHAVIYLPPHAILRRAETEA